MDREISLFLDCGAPSLYNKLMRSEQLSGVHAGAYFKDRGLDDFSFIGTEEYRKYRDDYIMFVKENGTFIDIYSNLDVINNPEATWKNQLYLESFGLNPLPVFHLGSDVKWLQMYLNGRYDYIALGGVVPNPPATVIPILDDLFTNHLCSSLTGLPKVKVHGFAVTSLKLMLRYPWYSVDSTSWVLTGRYGSIFVPRYRNGEYIYDESSWKVRVSSRVTSANEEEGKHILTFSPMEREQILDYIHLKGYKLGESEFRKVPSDYKPDKSKGERWAGKEESDAERSSKPNRGGFVRKGWSKDRIIEIIMKEGISNNYKLRDEMNIIYFLDLEKSLPEWPWPFKLKRVKGLLG